MKYFFITSLGRSGTKFLSKLINNSEEVICKHEPYRQDYLNIGLSYYYPNSTILNDNLHKRFESIKKNNSKLGYSCYGEVNSLLRYNAEWLKSNLNAKIVHIIRNPKDVVRSIYSRNVYRDGSSHIEIIPKNENPYSDKWLNMTRFEKICWYWVHTNEVLEKNIDMRFRFEDLIKDYNIFLKLIDYLDIPIISKELWEFEIKNPRNTSKANFFRKRLKGLLNFKLIKDNDIGDYDMWTEEQKNSFNRICSKTMRKYGY